MKMNVLKFVWRNFLARKRLYRYEKGRQKMWEDDYMQTLAWGGQTAIPATQRKLNI